MHAARYIRLGMRGDGPLRERERVHVNQLCYRRSDLHSSLPPLHKTTMSNDKTAPCTQACSQPTRSPACTACSGLLTHTHTRSSSHAHLSTLSLHRHSVRGSVRRSLSLPVLHITSHLLHTLLRTGTSARRSAALYSDAAKPVEALDPHAPSGLCAAVAPCLYEKIEVPAPAGTVDMISSEMSTLVNSL